MSEEQKNIVSTLKLSVSKVKTFDSCKKKYEYNYILHYPKKTWSFHTLGKFVHLVLEEFHRAYMNGSIEPVNIVMGKAYKTAMVEYKKSMTDDIKKEAYEIIDNYLKKITDEQHTLKNVLAVEKQFSFPITDHIILNGMIDKIEMGQDGILDIGDYKTTKNLKYMDDLLQLQTYAYVLMTEDPTIKQIRGAYIMLRHNFKRIEKLFGYDEIMEIKDQFIDYANKIENEDNFDASPSFLCNFCDFLNSCESGKEYLGKGKNIQHGEIKW